MKKRPFLIPFVATLMALGSTSTSASPEAATALPVDRADSSYEEITLKAENPLLVNPDFIIQRSDEAVGMVLAHGSHYSHRSHSSHQSHQSHSSHYSSRW